MPRLCIAGHRFWREHPGGVELQTRYLGESLHAAGWEVVYLCHSLKGIEGREELAPGCSLQWIPLYPYSWSVPRRELEQLLEELRPDVLYQRGWGVLQESGVVLEFALRRGLPYVFALSSDNTVRWRFPTVRTFLLHRRPRWRSWLLLPAAVWSDVGMHRLLRRAPYIFVQHEGQRQMLWHRYRRRGILLPTLHPELGRPVRKHPTPLVVWIHNYRPHAQLRLALRLAEELASQAEFAFVTGVTRPEQLSELRSLRALPPSVHLLGALPVDQAEDLLERAWVLLHTGLYEGFPNTFVQAWLRQTPVVSLWVDPGGVLQRQGLGVCAGGNRLRLRHALEWLLTHPDELRAMGEHARRYAEQVHGLTRNRHRLVQLFEKLLRGLPAEELYEACPDSAPS
ncbi:hypothetical protein HRbin21_00676 [bacterium HR21]|nr:hypothetical protein HRbin21_00676 [bacterium HR21]